jgi:hypothetical protein
MDPSLQAILGDLPVDAFLSSYWQKMPVAGRIRGDLFEELRAAFGDLSIPVLLNKGLSVASIRWEDPSGGYMSQDAPSSEARAHFEAGRTVFIPDLDVPPVVNWHSEIGNYLGAHKSKQLLALFIAPSAAMTSWHFDQIENFTVQLVGKRTWRWAKNTQVLEPLHNYSSGRSTPLQTELPLYGSPRLMAPAADEGCVTLSPGDFLYLPRGYWHEVGGTAGDTDSAALIVSYAALAWVEVLIPSLRTLVMRRSGWRSPVSTRLSLERQNSEFERIKADLRTALDELRLEDILPIVASEESASGRYQLHPLVGVQILNVTGETETIVFTRFQGALSEMHHLILPPPLVQVAEALARGEIVTVSDTCSPEVQSLMTKLSEKNIVRSLDRTATCARS